MLDKLYQNVVLWQIKEFRWQNKNMNDGDLEDVLPELNSFNIDADITAVCDECCLPLADYGYNPILSPSKNDSFVYREFCDLCAANFFGDEYFYDDVIDNQKILKFYETLHTILLLF